ncbi:MAG: AAA family ATPase [Verrucomicrobia bacterium]|nr:AAA family ATPase [Verrucomicrobiota bacterium]
MTDPIASLLDQLNGVIAGKAAAIRLAVCCLLARGHLLIEDVPGVGKTTLSQALARSLGLMFRRIQFTSDLLPADILGNSIFDRETGRFVFHPGPIFAPVVLIDEVNRATPKTQSALLEAMEENQVSADGVSHPLPHPFFVIATQNPRQQVGTFPLPESQLDRFLMRLELGFPDRAAEREMLVGRDRREMLGDLPEVLAAEQLAQFQHAARRIHVAPALLDYLQNLLAASRDLHPTGLSPRAGLGWLHAAQTWALMAGREMVLPEDVQSVALAVAAHRLEPPSGLAPRPGQDSGRELARQLLASVSIE